MAAGKFEQYGHAAEQLYLAGKSYTEIADLLPVSRTKLGDWGKAHNWEAKRKARTTSPGEIVDFVLDVLHAKLTELRDMPPEEIDAGMIDGIYKLMLMAEKLAKETRLLEKAVLVMDKYVDVVGATLTPDEREMMFTRINLLLTHLETAQS